LLVLAAFSVGRQSKEALPKVSTVAAVTTPPVLQRASPAALKPTPPTPKIIVPRPSSPPIAPEVSELLKKPEPKAERMIAANKPASVASQESLGEAVPDDMNYLQIESFLITRDRNGEQLAADLAHVRSYLLERGVRTFARKRLNGYVLFA